MKRIALVVVYVLGAFGTYGAMTAQGNQFNQDLVKDFGQEIACADHWSQRQNAMNVAVALFPPGWISAVFLTDFYAPGWALHPHCGS